MISRKQFDYKRYKNYHFGIKSAKRLYKKFIAYCKTSDKVKYYKYIEVHHIKPRSLGGSNSKQNLVTLTYQEHIFAHYLLAIIYPKTNMTYAFSMMISVYGGKNKNRKPSTITLFNSFAKYAVLKQKHVERMKKLYTGKPGRKLTEEEKKAISIRQTGEGNSRYGKKLSEEHKQALINSHLGKHRSKQTKEKISHGLTGKKKSKEHIQHIIESVNRPEAKEKSTQTSRTRGRQYTIHINDTKYTAYPYEFEQIFDNYTKDYLYIFKLNQYYPITRFGIRSHIVRYDNQYLYTKKWILENDNNATIRITNKY